MNKWNNLKSKSAKFDRIQRAAVPMEIFNSVKELLHIYKENRKEEILDDIRTQLIKHINEFSLSSRKRIELFLK